MVNQPRPKSLSPCPPNPVLIMTLPSQVAAMNAELKKEPERQRGWGRRDGELWFNGYRVSVWDGESVLEVDSGYGCITFQMHF